MPGDDPPVQVGPNSAALFRPRATTLFRAALLSFIFAGFAAGVAGFTYYRSPYWNRIGLAPDQPVLFSHRHHTAELKIDCRYCHSTVETSASAGMPSTHTCLTCHSQIFTSSPMLSSVVQSMEKNLPLHWARVNALPDHVYFNHSIHIAKGVACLTCHGEVGTMALTTKAEPLTMHWCIECHRNPAPQLRPHDELFSPLRLPSQSSSNQPALTFNPHVDTGHLTNCSTCHH